MRTDTKQLYTIGIIILILAGGLVVYAQTVDEPSDSFFGRFISKLKFSLSKIGPFTVYGDELGCDKYPTPPSPVTFKSTLVGATKNIAPEDYNAPFIFVNWFRGSPIDGTYPDHLGDSRQFIKEDYAATGDMVGWTCDSGAYWRPPGAPFGHNDCYYDVYVCSEPPCYSNSDCSGGEKCDKTILSDKIPNAGVCREEGDGIDHSTRVYSCTNGEKTFIEEVEHGDVNFCTDVDDIKYLIGTTDQCLPTAPLICSEIPGGDGELGEACTTDNDCKTLYCDKTAWYSLGQTCQPIPWDKTYKISLTKDQIKDTTTNQLISIACTSSEYCLPQNEDQTASCISLSKLRDDGVIQSTAGFFEKANTAIVGGTIGGLLNGAICAGGAITAGILFPPSAPLIIAMAPGACTALTVGGVILGGEIAVSFSNKDEIVKFLKAENADAVGLCVATRDSAWCDYTSWAAFFNITGDECVDGLIVIFGALLLVMLVMGGRRR